MMAIVTTYAFYDTTDHQREEAAVFNELNRQRRAHGVPDAQRVNSAPALQKALSQINQNTTTSLDGLNFAMTEISHTVHSSINGYIMETTDVSRLHFEPSLLAAASLSLQVGVTHYRVPGAAWGQYAVLFVILDRGAKTSEARVTTPPRL